MLKENGDFGQVVAESLPSARRLAFWRFTGRAVRDVRLRDDLAALRSET